MKTFITTLRLFVVLTLLAGVVYPLAVTAVAQIGFADQAGGSLVRNADNSLVGSSLLAQKTTSPRYFWPRPSAADFATVASGASNAAPTSEKLSAAVAERALAFRTAHDLPADVVIPADLLLASGSGLDPHLSPAAAGLQVARVAAARGLAPDQITALVTRHTETGGLLGEERVNVLNLNLALDHEHP